jgi:hypothetical protein
MELNYGHKNNILTNTMIKELDRFLRVLNTFKYILIIKILILSNKYLQLKSHTNWMKISEQFGYKVQVRMEFSQKGLI